MARALSVDSSFLIDLERERRRSETGPAHRFLRREADAELCIAAIALGELMEGYADPDHPVLWSMRRGHRVLSADEEVAVTYGHIARELRARGSLIGVNDLWIAATSLHHELPLVTSNVDHFTRVTGLEIIEYR